MQQKTFIGLDIGTESVGWAVTDESYRLRKYRGNLMWGVHLFDAASQAAERRAYRTSRRRLDRRQQRIKLLQELLAPAVLAVDPYFFLRLKESALFPEDAQYREHDLYFADATYNDAVYHREYPTIHHLICDLMENPAPHDVRLVYIACAYLLGHRGHFLRDTEPEKTEELLDFSNLYAALKQWLDENVQPELLADDCSAMQSVMQMQGGVKAKETELKDKLFQGKLPKLDDTFELGALWKLIAGGTVKLSVLFCKPEYTELEKDSACVASADFGDRLPELAAQLDDGHGDLLRIAKNIYDWSLLIGMLGGTGADSEKYSASKVQIYEVHQKDLRLLKKLCGKYLTKKQFDEIFRDETVKDNYVWYSYHFKGKIPKKGSRASQENFCKFIASKLKNIQPEEQDSEDYQYLTDRAAAGTLCPKQVNTDNRVIPYQLNYLELKRILEQASRYIPLLNECDKYGTVADKIRSIMRFRIPYYVGPLVSGDRSEHAWMVRKAEGKILPWNFDEKIDREASEAAFIKRMTCACSYLAGEDVLPKYSLLYSKFCVLNEINTLAIDGQRVNVEVKQNIYYALFGESKRRVSKKAIEHYLITNGLMSEGQVLSGVDDMIKSSLKSHHDFSRLLSSGVLTESDAEEIIAHITITTEKKRLRRWLRTKYKDLTEDDIRYLSNLNYQDYGRLSRRLLEEIYDIDPITDERRSERNLITALWETNENLMQLLSDRYGYSAHIAAENQKYYNEKPQKIEQKMDALYLPKPVRRAVTRTLDIVKELRTLLPQKPDRIFIEMARGGEPAQKGKRTVSRRTQIEAWLSAIRKDLSAENYSLLTKQLEDTDDGRLRSEKYYLYFMQLGRCMYSGQPIDFASVGNDALYNIDHIYPQSKTMDDSLDNKVLVLSELNGKKGDSYPISAEIRTKMNSFWQMLRQKELISQKKLERLTRNKRLTDEELSGFIARQIVETRQSTKATAMLLNELFPDTEIVYVKAGLVSQFRHDLDLLKCREINDLHHAKDAYLNIVIGNVYHVRFTKQFFSKIQTEQYSLRLFEKKDNGRHRGLLTAPIEGAWDPETSFAVVRDMMRRNSIRYVRYCYRRKGGLFHQQPERAGAGLISKKRNLPAEKYGGYNHSTASCFLPVKYQDGFIILPLELMFAEQICKDEDAKTAYCVRVLSAVLETEIHPDQIAFPLKDRLLKINTMLEVNGFRVNLIQKSNKGRTLVVSSAESLVADDWAEQYIKRLTSFARKSENGKNLSVTLSDRICKDENERLYDYLCQKCLNAKYKQFFSKLARKVMEGKPEFIALSETKQAIALIHLVELLKTGRSAGCDLCAFGASRQAGVLTLNSNLHAIKGLESVYIIDQSPTGLIEHRSENLLTL